MIYVDSNIPMYLVGAPHGNKQRVIELVPQLLSAREALVTSSEAFQEIVHHYLALRDRRHLDAAYGALEAIVSATAEVAKQDIDVARSISGQYPELSSRDCVHVAVMRRLGAKKIWSYDSGFEAVSAIERIR